MVINDENAYLNYIDDLSAVMDSQHSQNKVQIILSEYNALRDELMHFIKESRQNTTFQITTGFAQIFGLAAIEIEKIGLQPIIIMFLIGFPILNLLLFLRALEATSKILVLADYIHKGIKPQLSFAFASDEKYFEWEEHKARTKRVGARTILLLDSFKWLVFALAMITSYVLGLYVYSKSGETANLSSFISDAVNGAISETGTAFVAFPDLFVISLVILSFSVFLVIRTSISFNEVKGETFHLDQSEMNLP